jgi:hypothetical protein
MYGPELEPRGIVAGREVVVLWAVAGVHSLDFVARAASESAHVLRSIPTSMGVDAGRWNTRQVNAWPWSWLPPTLDGAARAARLLF